MQLVFHSQPHCASSSSHLSCIITFESNLCQICQQISWLLRNKSLDSLCSISHQKVWNAWLMLKWLQGTYNDQMIGFYSTILLPPCCPKCISYSTLRHTTGTMCQKSQICSITSHFINSRFEVHEKFHRCDIVHSNPSYMQIMEI